MATTRSDLQLTLKKKALEKRKLETERLEQELMEIEKEKKKQKTVVRSPEPREEFQIVPEWNSGQKTMVPLQLITNVKTILKHVDSIFYSLKLSFPGLQDNMSMTIQVLENHIEKTKKAKKKNSSKRIKKEPADEDHVSETDPESNGEEEETGNKSDDGDESQAQIPPSQPKKKGEKLKEIEVKE
jgi:hypothetical protein